MHRDREAGQAEEEQRREEAHRILDSRSRVDR